MTYKLPEGWKKVKLIDITEKIGSGATPRGGAQVYIDEGISLIRSQNILDFKFSTDGLVCIDEYAAKKLNNVEVFKDDILINITGDSVARTCLAPDYILPARVNQHVSIIRTDEELAYYKYINYKLQDLKTLLLSYSSSGATRKALTKSMLENLKINLPPIKEQKAIADTLSSLDNKIELNNNINKNLEQQAQAIFKNWFIDFEFPDENGNPYKSSGGEMVESELGMIPKGWEVVKLENLVTHIESGNWGKDEPQGNYIEEVLCVRGTDIPDIKKGDRGNMPTRYIISKHLEKKALRDGDIVVEMSGGSPTQSTGRALYVNQELLDNYTTPILCTNFCKIFKVRKEYKKLFYYNWEYLYLLGHMFSFENGTTGIKNLDEKSLLENNLLANPSEEILLKFNQYISIINANKTILGNQNQKLSQLRDTLLPKLMSGELRIPLD